MLRRHQRRFSYVLICVLLMAGMYTTYAKADSLAGRAASLEAAQLHMSAKTTMETQLRAPERALTQNVACVVESVNPLFRTVIGRVANRNSTVRRELRLPCILLWAIGTAYFIFNCRHIEEKRCLHEKKYRAALIKYIHDVDGKKRVTCLT